MMTAIEAAATLCKVAMVDTGEAPSSARLHKLLYYAQGLALATAGEPLFEGGFRADTHGPVQVELAEFLALEGSGWWRQLAAQRPQVPEEVERHLSEVLRVFGGWTATELANAARAERPWSDATTDMPWGRAADEPIGNVEILDHFAEMAETGEDAMAELGIAKEPDRPWWVRPYEVAVNLKRMSGHPMFDDAESRSLRLRMGLLEFPDSLMGPDIEGHAADDTPRTASVG